MTENLLDTMHHYADSLGAPDLDVLGMVREGNRRARRRRNAVLGAGVAAAVVAAIAVPTVMSGRDTAREVTPASAFAEPQPSWATGSTVHVGGQSFDMGRPVDALYVTTEGIVFADPDGTVYASDGAGAATEIGTVDLSYGGLVGDGARAGWIEHEAGSAPEFMVYDQATGETQRIDYDAAGEGATEYHPSFFALDGEDAWLRDARGVVRWDVGSGVETVVGQPLGAEIQDVKSGVIAHTLPAGDPGDPGDPGDVVDVYAGPDFGQGGPLDLMQTSSLNPSGTKLLGYRFEGGAVYADTATGSVTALDAPGYDQLNPYAWLDDDSFAAVALAEGAGAPRHDLLTCDVGGSCTVVGADLPDVMTFSIGFAGSTG